MRILVACESSGQVRRAFAARGHFVVSCDLLPAADAAPFGNPHSPIGQHYQGDIFDFIDGAGDEPIDFDLMIAHPSCQFLAVSGLHWNGRRPGRAAETEKALDFVRRLMAAPFDRIAIENPVSCISTRIRKPDQTIQPYQFGHDASKRTCLWLKNLPRLKPTGYVEPRMIDGKPRWANQTDSGQNKLTPADDRWQKRSETYAGIAEAMSTQWGVLPVTKEALPC